MSIGLAYVPSYPDTTGWKDRHLAAVAHPRPNESVVTLIKTWLLYAEAHQARYESAIGDDGVLGPAWIGMGRGLRTLLNGETGRLDCGTLDHIVCEALQTVGGLEESEL